MRCKQLIDLPSYRIKTLPFFQVDQTKTQLSRISLPPPFRSRNIQSSRPQFLNLRYFAGQSATTKSVRFPPKSSLIYGRCRTPISPVSSRTRCVSLPSTPTHLSLPLQIRTNRKANNFHLKP